MKKRFYIATLSAIMLTACSGDDDVAGNAKHIPIELSDVEQTVNTAQKEFAFNFFNQVCLNSDEPNVITSPFSASMALSMLANGADGATLSQFKRVIGCSDIESLNQLNRKFSDRLPLMDNRVTLSIGNSVWLDKNYTATDVYVCTMRQIYNADVKETELSSIEAMNTINSWCSRKTSGLIDRFLDEPLKKSCHLFVANALYFNGKWSKAFRKVKPGKFNNADGTVSTIDKMTDEINVGHSKYGDYEAISIPYGNGSYNMLVIMTSEGLPNDNIDYDTYKGLRSAMPGMGAIVSMPKFTVNQKFDIMASLTAMGLTDAFDEAKANFTGLSDNRLSLGGMQQAIYLNVTENGTEAAAVTGNGDPTSPGIEPKAFFVNRPFVFLIEEQSTGAVLFMGRINKL